MLFSSIQSEAIRTFHPSGTNLRMKVLETFAPYCNILWARGFWKILGSNIRQENWQNSQRFLTISSSHVPNCSNISEYICYSQKELKNFAPDILRHFES